MDFKSEKRTRNITRAKRRKKTWQKIVTFMAAIVVFCTTYALILPAISMEKTEKILECPLSVHKHEQSCRDEKGNLICWQADYVVHKHADNCYDSDGKLVCTLPEIEKHEHKAECYRTDSVLACGKEESSGHVHTENCYAMQQGNLICGTEETAGHVHGESCLDENGTLICGQNECAAHTHSDQCYEWNSVTVCGLNEGEGSHTHTESCYGTVKVLTCGKLELHKHTKECENGLKCQNYQLLEHVHEDGCFVDADEASDGVEMIPTQGADAEEEVAADDGSAVTDAEVTPAADGSSAVTGTEETPDAEDSDDVVGTEETPVPEEDNGTVDSEESEDIESTSSQEEMSISEETVEESDLDDEDVVNIEGSDELENSSENTAVEGQVAIQLTSGEAAVGEEVTLTAVLSGVSEEDILSWQWQYYNPVDSEEIEESEETDVEDSETAIWNDIPGASEQSYTFVITEENADWYWRVQVRCTGQEAAASEATPTPAAETVSMDGDVDEIALLNIYVEGVQTNSDGIGEESNVILVSDGYTVSDLIITEKSAGVYECENDEFKVEVTLPSGNELPDGTVLSVTAITASDESFTELTQQAEEAIDGTPKSIQLYDISFYSADGEYIPMSEEAEVFFKFKENVSGNSDAIEVLHYAEDGELPIVLEEVGVELDDDEEIEAVTFTTEGFSVFAIVLVGGYESATTTATVDVSNLDGKSYVIANKLNDIYYVMMSEAYSTTRLSIQQVTADSDNKIVDEVTAWTFEKVGTYTYDNETQYTYYIWTVVDGVKKYLNLGTTGTDSLTLSTTAQVLTVVAGTGSTEGRVLICTERVTDGTSYTINMFQGDGANGFSTWTFGFDDWPNGQYLLEASMTENLDLDKKSYAIVNKRSSSSGVALLSGEKTEGNTKLLAGTTVTIDGDYIKSDSDITIWTFTEHDNAYYISTVVDNETKYLQISGSNVFLSSEPMDIYVTARYDGLVRLTNSSGMAVNLYGGNADRGFGGYNDNKDGEYHLLCEVVSDIIFYDLNIGGDHVVSSSQDSASYWGGSVPEISSEQQNISNLGTKLYTVQGIRNDETGYFNYCSNLSSDGVKTSENKIQEFHELLKQDGHSVGKEFEFEGWEATVDGTTYLFAEDATATLKEDGIHIVDVNGGEVTLPIGTTLKGKWTLVSDTVLFFVNYSGTVLDTEGDVTGRNQKEFTPCIAIGRIYFGKTVVGADGIFAESANVNIRNLFRNQYDPNDSSTQIVLEYVSFYDTTVYNFSGDGSGYNEVELDTATLKYIKDSNSKIKISTVDNVNNPYIDSNNADSDHYEVRWYVLKEQDDAWHVDGVLVAKTAAIEVIKTFSGLEDSVSQDIMDKSLNIDVKLGKDAQKYINISDSSILDQCTYHGKDASGFQIYSWTLNAITDEIYNLQENDYELDGYDCVTIVVVRTKDGNYYSANGDYTKNITNADNYLVGGIAERVSFNNFYTEEGTGILNIVKRDGTININDPSGKLSGAIFTLTDGSGSSPSVTTNINGSATFVNLKVGTYILKETGVPDGYNQPMDGDTEKTWIVVVSESSGTITVTVDGQEVYKTGSVIQPYVIDNTPAKGTLTIKKQFLNVTESMLKDLKGNYKIVVERKETATGDDSANETTVVVKELTLSSDSYETVSTDGRTFTWRLTDIKPGDFLITEMNFRHVSVKDTIVGTSNPPVDIDYDNQIADFEISIEDGETGNVLITNNYTDEFTLKVKKTDADGNILTGAEFDIYGAYAESVQTSKQVTYIDGNEYKTAYYIGSIVIGDDGTGTVSYNSVEKGLNLSDSTESYTYVLLETKAPSGYALLKEPIVIKNVGPGLTSSVTDTAATGSYYNGVYTLNVKNVPYTESKVTIKVSKKWQGVSEDSAPAIELQLYRKTETTAVEAVENVVTLNGKEDEEWTYTWSNQEAYDENGNEYIYYVGEKIINQYVTDYSEEVYLDVRGTSIYAGKTAWNLKDLKYEVTITNTSSYNLPKTGGKGTLPYKIGGVLLMGCMVVIYLKERRKGGRRSSLKRRR